MKFFSFAFLTVILFFSSCAGGPAVGNKAPDWADTPLEHSDTSRAFRGVGDEGNVGLAETEAIEDLKNEIMKAMDLEGSEAFNLMFEKIESMIRTSGSSGVDGVEIIHNEGWKNSTGTISFMIDITWDNEAFEKQRDYLIGLGTEASPGFKDLEIRAGNAEKDGNFYEAALIWAAAAGIARKNGNTSGYRTALDAVVKALENLEFVLESYPEKAYVGLRPESPVIFQVSSRGQPVSNAEFLITYPRNNRDGSPSIALARISSDRNGIVRFLPPEVSFAGTQLVSIAPSAVPFLEYLDESGDRFSSRMADTLESPGAQAEYEAFSRIRTIPTGILILETDLAGNTLNTDDTARGLLDDLAADGFNIRIMDLDPSEMLARSDAALIRDLKADTRLSDVYQRVIYGKVALESFEKSGGSYSVKVSGTLTLSDIDRQTVIQTFEITKSSQASSSTQAISAAFRQLGRSFAGELINQAP